MRTHFIRLAFRPLFVATQSTKRAMGRFFAIAKPNTFCSIVLIYAFGKMDLALDAAGLAIECLRWNLAFQMPLTDYPTS
jgi:hypothetical protein